MELITPAQAKELRERFQHDHRLRVTVGQPGSLREGTVVGMEPGTVTAAARVVCVLSCII